jgi:lipoprotein-releasing system ATP-binding protein
LHPAPLLRIEGLTRIYKSGDKDLTVFQNLDLFVGSNEQVAITGESGAGKSTLLHLIAGLDQPTAGRIVYRDRDITKLDEAGRTVFRNQEMGMVWQQHHLLPEFTAEENVMMPLLIRGTGRPQASRAAEELLEETGVLARRHHRAGELSGGEQQRIALARALAGNPSLLLADEPTGNLDEKTGAMVFDLLRDLRERRNLTLILVTHNLHFAARMDRTLRLEGGRLREALATDSREGVSL